MTDHKMGTREEWLLHNWGLPRLRTSRGASEGRHDHATS
jgi:hypothetical protein